MTDPTNYWLVAAAALVRVGVAYSQGMEDGEMTENMVTTICVTIGFLGTLWILFK